MWKLYIPFLGIYYVRRMIFQGHGPEAEKFNDYHFLPTAIYHAVWCGTLAFEIGDLISKL